MHSRIIQLSTEPIQEENYIIEANYYDHWFTHQIADYVSGEVDRDETINWLKSDTNGIIVDKDEHGFYIVITDKMEYFKHKFSEFRKTLLELSNITISDFIDNIYYKIFHLRNSYEDKYGFYIDEEDGLKALDSFIRNETSGIKYYIGGVIDYHF